MSRSERPRAWRRAPASWATSLLVKPGAAIRHGRGCNGCGRGRRSRVSPPPATRVVSVPRATKPTSRDRQASILAGHFDGAAIIAVRQRAIFFLRNIDELAQQQIAEHERDRERRKDDKESPGGERAVGLMPGPGRGCRPAAFLFHDISALDGAGTMVVTDSHLHPSCYSRQE